MELARMLEQYGPWVLLTGYFIWQSGIREARMLSCLVNSETFIRDKMYSAIEGNTAAVSDLRNALNVHPCLHCNLKKDTGSAQLNTQTRTREG